MGAIIAAIILILVIAFTVGSAGTTFSKIGKAGTGATGDEIDTIRNNCRAACSTAQNTVSNGRDWTSSKYCLMKASIDVNADGTLADVGVDKEINLKCWANPINIECGFTFETGGTTKKIDTATAGKPGDDLTCDSGDVQVVV